MEEKLYYLLNYLDYCIEQSIYDVINDSEADPQYSAVTAYNLMVCYIDVMHSMGANGHISSPEEYMRDKCFTDEEISLINQKKEKESVYYVGVQY